MHIPSAIEQLGYSPHEVKVYLAVLKLGESTATDIAEKTQIPRTTVNLIIDSLHRKGLLNAYLQHRRKIWTAENPNKLLMRLKEREAALKVILPELRSFQHNVDAKFTVRTYNGAEEIKQIMNDILETKHHFSAIHLWDDWVDLLGRSYMDDFIESRIRQHMHVRLLVPKTKMTLALKEKDSKELRITQFFSDSITINNSNFMYGNKVAIISMKTKQPVGILIENKDIHHTMEVLFESLWRQSGGA
ncbi:MAG: BlaI/MecI/CopY family transcriptional regulator [Candidatus Parcubacteria bacterium]|nr:BlaI/MecI/CopY family transcriptional regulator [Candidatus Parcubacteria bacterium]